jgi:hypothetical protein
MTGQHSAPASACSAQRGSRGRADAGLVPSINNAETRVFIPTFGGAEVVTVDKVQARCTRLRKNLGVASKWLSQGQGQAWMLTFTYKRVEDWKPCHMREALTHLRKWLKRTYGARLRYLWVMETQSRKSGDQIGQSAPHYHCVVWLPVQIGRKQLQFDSLGWWPHGHTNAVKAVAPVRYVMKYASKFDNAGNFPKGARIYGVGGMDAIGAGCRRWINWPAFVQANSSVGDCSRRAKGGGWVIGRTGEWLPSEWGLSIRNRSSAILVRVHTHAREIEDPRGPFSWLKP